LAERVLALLSRFGLLGCLPLMPHDVSAGPIRMVVVEQEAGTFSARELSRDEIDDQRQVIAGAEATLREWRSVIAGTKRATETTGTQEPEPSPAIPPGDSESQQ
jgi:hypothetical protein